MSLPVIHFKDLNVNQVKFSKNTVKQGSNYVVELYYNAVTPIVQSATCIVKQVRHGVMEVQCLSDGFLKLVKDFESILVSKVYKHSEVWFNGKRFSKSKLEGSFKSKFNADKLLTVELSDTMLVYDQYKRKQDINVLQPSRNVVMLLKLQQLLFEGKSFSYRLVCEQARVFVPETFTSYSLIDDNQTILDNTSDTLTEEAYEEVCTQDSDFF